MVFDLISFKRNEVYNLTSLPHGGRCRLHRTTRRRARVQRRIALAARVLARRTPTAAATAARVQWRFVVPRRRHLRAAESGLLAMRRWLIVAVAADVRRFVAVTRRR